jgi:hypothetical protein
MKGDGMSISRTGVQPLFVKASTVARLARLKQQRGARTYRELCDQILHERIEVESPREVFRRINVSPEAMATLRMLSRGDSGRRASYDEIVNAAIDEASA